MNLFLSANPFQAAATRFSACEDDGGIKVPANAADRSGTAQYRYGPFGEVLRATGPMAKVNPFRFSTKYQDDETDLVRYEPGRYYGPSCGACIRARRKK